MLPEIAFAIGISSLVITWLVLGEWLSRIENNQK